MSVKFEWDPKEFEAMLKNCQKSTILPFVYEYLPQQGLMLEAGCGLGQFVKFFQDQGYAIKGIEVNQDTVKAINTMHPELDIVAGDVAQLPYPDNSFASILSLGVVEHFVEGPEAALREMYRVMKPGAVALICVPCFNWVRKIKYYTGLDKVEYYLRKVYYKALKKDVSWMYGGNTIKSPVPYRFHRWPALGNFFEYRFSLKEFDTLLVKAGFTIKHRAPIELLGGLFHEFGGVFFP